MNFPFYVFAWIASLSYAVEVIIGKITSRHSIKNVWLFNFVWSSVMLIFTVPFAISGGISWPHHWQNLIIASAFGAASGIGFMLVLYRFDASVLSPLYNFRAAFAVFLGVAFLGETLSLKQISLIAIIFLAGMIVTLDEHWSLKSFFNKSMIIASITMVVSAFSAMYVNRSIHDVGYWNTIFYAYILELMIYLLTAPKFYKDIKTLNKRNWGVVALISALGVIGALAASKAFESNIGISSVITSLPISMFIAAIFSFTAPNLLEKHTAKVYAVRFASAAIMVVCALNL